MTTRPRLYASVAYWILIIGSIASVAVGAWLVVSKLSTMTTTLKNGSATGVEVYAGQSWIVFGCVLVGAGLVGIVVVLALAVVRALLPAAPAQEVAPIDWTAVHSDDEPLAEEISDADALVAEPAVAEPVAAAEKPADADKAEAATDPVVETAPEADEPRAEAPAEAVATEDQPAKR
jgi:hypothetical protein